MAKRKRKRSTKNDIAITIKSNEFLNAFSVALFFLIVPLFGALLGGTLLSFLSFGGMSTFDGFRYSMVGISIPVIFALGYRLKTGEWWEGSND